MCCGCFGCGLRRVSKKDERLAALRSDVEPIRGVHAQHTYWRYVADFPHVRCSLHLTVCQPTRRNGVRLGRRRSAPPTLCSCCWARMDQGASGLRDIGLRIVIPKSISRPLLRLNSVATSPGWKQFAVTPVPSRRRASSVVNRTLATLVSQ